MNEVTVVVANKGAKYAFELMVRSLNKWHPEMPLFVCDTGSLDGCDELGKKYATEYVEAPVSHGVALDLLVSMVKTPYVLTVDNDLEFLAPVVDDMIREGAFCVSPPDRYGQGSAEWMGAKCEGQPRIDPCCALFKTEPLKRLLKHTSFAFYVSPHQRKHWDTGGQVHNMANVLGYTMSTPAWLWSRVFHAGSVTWGLDSPVGSYDNEVAIERYARIQARLKQGYGV